MKLIALNQVFMSFVLIAVLSGCEKKQENYDFLDFHRESQGIEYTAVDGKNQGNYESLDVYEDGQETEYATSGSENQGRYDPLDFLGEWQATEYIASNEYQVVDFFPEKYIGHVITIEENSFYMQFWDGILEPVEVSGYLIRDVETETIQYVWFHIYENIFESDQVPVLFYYDEYGIESFIGVVVDKDTLLCTTSSGWYVYERMD